MERYFASAKARTTDSKTNSTRPDKTSNTRYKPYTTDKNGRKTHVLLSKLSDDAPPSNSTLTKLVLKTLKDESNPIAHSDIGLRSDHVVSMAGGHQHSEGKSRHREYFEDRNRKLEVQGSASSSSSESTSVLRNVRAYIDGFLDNTTDIEMKRIVREAGGQILATAAGATHILTSQPLSGSKTHKILTKKSKIHVHVVRPQWVFDSIKAGKRRPERDYSIINDNTTKKLREMWQQ
ncbi:hypothetical protein VNI00_001265 [Paramarasmius palmivorus]|uniref:BRCT domain-containing protein n=1 Tax=Paramarasmius palmivorus TaxID=297713 RepID=A0AAW0E663_9AGAR